LCSQVLVQELELWGVGLKVDEQARKKGEGKRYGFGSRRAGRASASTNCVVIPAHNEAQNLRHVLPSCRPLSVRLF